VWLHVNLSIIQKRGSLSVLGVGSTNLLSEESWNGDDKGCEEENRHNGEGKDPLEGNGLGEELTNTKVSTENAESESHSVISVNSEEKQAIDQDTPDGNIGKDTCR